MSTEKDLQQGRVVWAAGGFYTVLVGAEEVTCRIRGRLKQQAGGVFTGDLVQIERFGSKDGVIEEIMPRKLVMKRPNIANVDQAVLQLAARDPDCDLLLLDKMLLNCAHLGVQPLILFNKCDLLESEAAWQQLASPYIAAGYRVIRASVKQGLGVEEVRAALAGHITVFTGPSGAGKSSLLNALMPELQAEVGEISQRLQRGKHTTRQVSIHVLAEDAMVADSPGFQLLDLAEDLTEQRCAELMPEFAAYDCRFEQCLHDKEPDCAVKAALAAGKIDEGRYQRYLRLLTDLREREVKY